ncbi:MAG: hypothetical protein PF961_07375 [Planctomycetota bacterium]|nr:hypothetical protein [Planctomycetota bacterium]
MILALLLIVSEMTAADPVSVPVWDHLPQAVYLEEDLHMAVALPNGWHVMAGDKQLDSAGAQTVRVPAEGAHALRVVDANGEQQQRIALLRPGAAGALDLTEGRLRTRDGDHVVLALSRREHSEDRRWLFLRNSESAAQACEVLLAAEPVALGESGLLAVVQASRRSSVFKQGVVVQLPGDDRLVGWNHRHYRQCVAWVVADLWARGARRIVLVQGPVSELERTAMEPLWAQARDVARTYNCELQEAHGLLKERYWLLAEGLLGDRLNAAGEAELVRIRGRFLEPGK